MGFGGIIFFKSKQHEVWFFLIEMLIPLNCVSIFSLINDATLNFLGPLENAENAKATQLIYVMHLPIFQG